MTLSGRRGRRARPQRRRESARSRRAPARSWRGSRPPIRRPTARSTTATPLELLVATILSAQCTDVRVNLVTPALFATCPTAAHYAAIPIGELEALIQSTGFFRNKAKSLSGLGRALVERHGGEVPRSMAELVALPGVGRKTANVVLGNAFAMNDGVVVDTHVGRLAARLGLSESDRPGEDRAGPHAALPARRLDPPLAPPDRPRPQDLQRPQAPLRQLSLADLCPSASASRLADERNRSPRPLRPSSKLCAR